MNNKKETGKLGEDLATEYLQKLGYKIIERNFSCKRGEIDIIAVDKEELVFIEVKTRKILTYGNPGDAVDKLKQKHIYRTAEYYLLIKNQLNVYTRIDVIEVYIKENGYKINHIKRAIIDKWQEQNLIKDIKYMQEE